MGNKSTPTNAFGPGNQPANNGNTRGKANMTKYLAAMQKVMSWSESDLYEHIVTEAFVNKDKEYRQHFFNTSFTKPTSTKQPVQFQYDRSAPYHEKAEVVMEAMSKGEIPPDVALDIISSIKHIATVHEQEQLVKRIEQLEELLKAQGNSMQQQFWSLQTAVHPSSNYNAPYDPTAR